MPIVNVSYDGAKIATPSDTTNETKQFNGFIVWSAGTVSFVDSGGVNIPASASLPTGTLIAVKGVRINATGTTATVLLLTGVA